MEWLDRGWLAVGVIGGLVVLFNLGLLYALLSGSAQTQLDMLRRIARQARHPWRRENEALLELRKRALRLIPDDEVAADDE